MNNLQNLSKIFDYHLPPNLIADSPVSPRDHCRLLLFNKTNKEICHQHFYNLIDQLTPNDVLILNQTKVFPARLLGKKTTGGKVEILLLETLRAKVWRGIAKPGLKINTTVSFDQGLTGIINKFYPNTGEIDIEFNQTYLQILKTINKIGHTPIPPYIHSNLTETQLRNSYQTIYAKAIGSAAAPTAGLHFTQDLLKKLIKKGITVEYVTLHVGLGTFQPLRQSNIDSGKLHHEYYQIKPETIKRLLKYKTLGKRLIAVGTTTVRTLESYALTKKLSGTTDLFIYPPFKFRFIDSLITNFHLPKSSLLMLVTAFTGSSLNSVYQSAIDNKYRFFSFGDAMWIY